MFAIKQGSTSPSLVRSLGMDLTGATVEFRLTTSTFKPVAKGKAAVIDPTEGRVRYDWQPGDTKDHGDFLAEWAIKRGNVTDVVPADGYDEIKILRNLG